MEPGADILPAGSDQNISLNVNNRNPDLGDRKEVVHEELNLKNIDDFRKIKGFKIPIRREDCMEFLL